MVEEKELAFWLLKNGWVATPKQGLRFVQSAMAGECTEEMMDSLSMKVLLDKGLDTLDFDDLTKGLPEVHSDEVMSVLKEALEKATGMIEYWHAHPGDTNARFFRLNMRNANWEIE